MEEFKKKAVKILEEMITGYLYHFLYRTLPDKETCELREKTIGAIQYAHYIGIINKEKFEYYIDRVYLEEDKPL